MHSNAELQRWGEIFSKNQLHKVLGMSFYQFMSLSQEKRQQAIQNQRSKKTCQN